MSSVKLLGLDSLLVGLQRTEDRTHARLRRAVERGAKRIGDRAREYAPVDQHDLENAIRDDVRVRDARNRLVMVVGVDYSRLGPGYSVSGFDYAVEMHENYPYPIGGIPDLPHLQGSYQKQASGKRVGGQFLARALDEEMEGIQAEMRQILAEIGR